VLNYIWLTLVLLAVAIGGWNDRLKDVSEGALDGAKTAVTIALALIGIVARREILGRIALVIRGVFLTVLFLRMVSPGLFHLPMPAEAATQNPFLSGA
jgi:spore maturation protein SpmA